MTDQPGVHPAPYLARAKWIQIDPANCKLPESEIAVMIEKSYELVFGRLTKKLQREIGGD